MTTIRGVAAMPDRHEAGVVDTSTYIDLDQLDPALLPATPEITAITMAELHQGVAMARTPAMRAARTEKLGAAIVDFDPLPFDGEAAARYGTLVAMTLSINRDPRPRRLDLMIAAIASSRGLPLFTRNEDEFRGLDTMITVIAV